MGEKEMTIKDIIVRINGTFQFLKTKWVVITFFVLLGCGIGLYRSIVSQPLYLATLKFVVVEENKGGGGLSALASSFGLGGDASGSLFSSSNLIELLKTRSMIEETLLRPIRESKFSKKTYVDLFIEEYDLLDIETNDKISSKLEFKINEDRLKFTREKDSLLGKIARTLIDSKIVVISQPNKENSILQVDVNSKNEVFSKNFPLELVEVVSLYYSESKTQKSKKTVETLQFQVDSINLNLNSSMNKLTNASDNVFGLNPAMSSQKVPAMKEQIQMQMNSVMLQELVKNLEFSKMKLMDETPIIDVIEKPNYPLNINKLGKIKGVVFGGIIGMFIIIMTLLARQYIKSILKTN
jgi:hypothetical protein